MLNNKPYILIVDDDPMICAPIEAGLKQENNEVAIINDAKEALVFILDNSSMIDAIILDRRMPHMDGLQIVHALKEEPTTNQIPIIMQTQVDQPDQISEGIEAGVFYYLAKPINMDILKTVTHAAAQKNERQRALYKERASDDACFGMINNCQYKIQRLEDAENLAIFIAKCFPDRGRVVTGIAELLINAIEHGHLGIGDQLKGELISAGTWHKEIEKRAELPENKNKIVDVAYRRDKEGHYITISDEGDGFNWKEYIKISPPRSAKNHGHGIAQAVAVCFDHLSYNEKGNEVTGFVRHRESLEW